MLERKTIQVNEVMEQVAELQDISEDVSFAFNSSDFDMDELRNELRGMEPFGKNRLEKPFGKQCL